VQRQCASVVTERSQDAFVGASIENGTTVRQFDLRKRDFPCALGTTATLCGRQEPYHSDMHALSTFPHPLTSRFIVAQGSSLDAKNQRVSFTPEIKGVSTSQPMSHSVIRLACSRAGVCGVSLRHLARLFAALCLMPMPKSSIKRGMDDMGSHRPPPEDMLRHLRARTPVTECPMDGDYP
jgi:hypothetical protein